MFFGSVAPSRQAVFLSCQPITASSDVSPFFHTCNKIVVPGYCYFYFIWIMNNTCSADPVVGKRCNDISTGSGKQSDGDTHTNFTFESYFRNDTVMVHQTTIQFEHWLQLGHCRPYYVAIKMELLWCYIYRSFVYISVCISHHITKFSILEVTVCYRESRGIYLF